MGINHTKKKNVSNTIQLNNSYNNNNNNNKYIYIYL